MILLCEEIMEALQKAAFTIPGIKVRDDYTVETISCPLLVLEERPGNTGVYLDNQPKVVRNLYILEAYTRDMRVEGKPLSKKAAAMRMLMEADKQLNEKYGLTMNGEASAAPYNDPTVFRAVARYTAYIDTRTNTIVRRV